MTQILAFVAACRDVLAAGFFVGLALTTLYAAVKTTVAKATGKPFPRNAVTLFLDGCVEALPNVVGLVNKWLQAIGQPPILPPALPPAPPPASPADPPAA